MKNKQKKEIFTNVRALSRKFRKTEDQGGKKIGKKEGMKEGRKMEGMKDKPKLYKIGTYITKISIIENWRERKDGGKEGEKEGRKEGGWKE